MFDANRLLGSMIRGGMSNSRIRSGGFGVGGLGAAGLIGGLAVAAFEHFSDKQRQGPGAGPPPPGRAPQGQPPQGFGPPPPPPPGGGMPPTPPAPPAGGPPPPPPGPGAPPRAPEFAAQEAPPAEPAVDPQTAMLLIGAMIQAAKADGAVDQQEMRGILDRLEQAGAEPDDRAFVMTEIAKPLDLDGLVARVRDPALAPDVYAASLMAIEIDTPEEHAYLRSLAEKLGLGSDVVAQLHEQLGAPPPAA
jgi:uncharacterized membrane protein YebE (DUF533 family)